MEEEAGGDKVPFTTECKALGPVSLSVASYIIAPIVEVIKNGFPTHIPPQNPSGTYELLWKRSDQHREVRLHGEVYTSDAFREAHNVLQTPPRANCDLPRVVVD